MKTIVNTESEPHTLWSQRIYEQLGLPNWSVLVTPPFTALDGNVQMLCCQSWTRSFIVCKIGMDMKIALWIMSLSARFGMNRVKYEQWIRSLSARLQWIRSLYARHSESGHCLQDWNEQGEICSELGHCLQDYSESGHCLQDCSELGHGLQDCSEFGHGLSVCKTVKWIL